MLEKEGPIGHRSTEPICHAIMQRAFFPNPERRGLRHSEAKAQAVPAIHQTPVDE